MILESLVTTTNPDGSAHLAAMGPRVDPAITRLTLRPFKTASTFANLKRLGQGVMHVTDDVELVVQAALQQWSPPPATKLADQVDGYALVDCCRRFEFVVERIDDTADRAEIPCRIVRSVEQRPFFGLNRAKHAVLEAAILATRLHLLPWDVVADQLDRLQPLIEKTGGDVERRAWARVADHIARASNTMPDRWCVSS